MTTLVLSVVALWIVVGAAAGLVMARRGHNVRAWVVLGGVFGPFVVPYVLASLRREAEAAPVVVTAGEAGTGPVDVLVGIDGSPESRAAVVAVEELLGDRLGRFTLVTVVDFETASYDDLGPPPYPADAEAARARAEQILADAAAQATRRPETLVLAGAPALVLARHAVEGGYDLVVVGHRGRGLSRAILGSVARELARDGKVPVLIAGR